MANFVAWYYAGGVAEWIRLWRNAVRRARRFFAIGELFATLFSPWHRDVTFPDWRGFHPVKSLNMLATNLIARFIGSIVRSVVILFGLFVCAGLVITGIVSVGAWLAWPVLFFAALFTLPWLPGIGISLLLFLSVIGFFASRIYAIAGAPSPDQLEWSEIVETKWFERALYRISLTPEDRDSFHDPEQVRALLGRLQIAPEIWATIVAREAARETRFRTERMFWSEEHVDRTLPLGRFWKYGYTVHLDRHSVDLSIGDPTKYRSLEFFGRDADLEMLELGLTRPSQNSLLLVGDHGIGKRTMIHTLARHLRENRSRYAELRDIRVLWFDFGRAVADVVDRGEDIELALHRMFYETAYAGNVVIVIENLAEHLLDATGRNAAVSSVLIHYLSLPTFRLIALVTSNERQRLQKDHPGVMKYFETIAVKEPDVSATTEIVYQYFEEAETDRVLFTHRAIVRAVELAGRFDWEHPYPERAINLAEATLNWWLREQATPVIIPETVDEFIAQKTGMPLGEITEDEKTRLLKLEEVLHRRVIGQNEAISQLAEALRKARTGIGNAKRPIASFLFLGPTGVGKTETVKAIAEAFFGDENRMIRLDMSEFQAENSIDRLIGQGDREHLGFLTAQAKEHPFSLLLLDELEKASPDVLDLFLQVLEDGFLTDAAGERINFRNMIIVATSNAGSILIKQGVEQGIEGRELDKRLVDTLVSDGTFRLEFLNRFDGIIFFQSLNDGELRQVAELQLRRVAERLLKEKNIRVDFDPALVEMVIQKGYEPIFGARSLRRFIENSVEDAIVKKILSNETGEGQSVTVRAEDIG